MRKRLSGKLLSVILALAICATTVLGCLMTVSAATSCYTFGEAVFAEDDLTQATMDVTFTKNDTLPDGFSAGAFTLTEVDADDEDCLTVKSVVAKTAGVNLTNEGDYYVFDSAEAKSEVTFTLTFGFSAGEANTSGKVYKVKLTNVELANSDSAYLIQDDADGAIGEISAGCAHSVTGIGTPIATGDASESAPYGYAVYKESVCTLCGEQFGYQLIPTAEALDNADAAGTIDLLEFSTTGENLPGSTSKYWDTGVADNGETGADWDNAIIIDSAEELVYLCKASGDETKGLYYKVADGIAGFDLSKGDLDLNGTLADNIDKIKAGGKNHAGGTPGFQGYFDGNGATVYGAWTNHTSVSAYVGLFSCTYGDVIIKNINVNKASFTGKNAAGGIVGYHKADDAKSTLLIENCSVTDSHIEITGTGYGCGVGAILGFGASAPSHADTDDIDGDGNTTETVWENVPYVIKNCYVNLDETYFISAAEDGTEASGERACHGGVVGVAGSNALNVSNCVVIGITPYATSESTAYNDVQHSGLESHFTNVYTTSDVAITDVALGGTLAVRDFTGKIFPISNLKGSAGVVNMPALDWGTTWVMDGTNTYPRLVKPGETFDTIYWDGANTKTAPTVGSGTPEDPFIINTVAEFAYITGQGRDNYAITLDKHYKIADGIKSIVMQPYAYGNDIKALDSAAATKAYFEANAANMKQWLYYGWEGSTFCGDIDFNGATVYGIYQVSSSNAGLISNVDAGAVIRNVAIKNSYMTSTATNYQVGAIAAVTNGTTYGQAKNGFIWMENCTVANNYMYCNATFSTVANGGNTRAGVLVGASTDILYIDNCLAYGNNATLVDGSNMPLYSQANNSVLVSDAPAIPDGLTVVDDGAETPRYYNMVRNSVLLGFNPLDLSQGFGSRFNDIKSYENCYTDASLSTDTNASGKTVLTQWGVEETNDYLSVIATADALGSGAQTAMPNLTWGTDWYTGDEGEYPAQSPYVTVGVANSSNSEFTIAGTNIVYEEDGSFSLNIHYIPAYEGFAPTMYIGDTNCTKLYVLDTPVASSCRAEIGDNTAMMFTLKGISAKNIDKLWHPTLVAQNGASLDWSRSAEISVANTATATLEGDYDTADKNVAAAVLMYGGKSVDALAVGSNDYEAGTIDLLEFGDYLKEAGSTSNYYDTVVADNGEAGTEADPIIIDSAEELVYLCKASGNETAGLYYKVADGIAGFNLSTNKLDITKDYKANESVITNSGKNHSGNTPGFQGHFDGNGATVYGAVINSSNSSGAGLFSCTKGDVTIKNINVRLSRFVGKYGVGGIVGYHEATITSGQAKTATTNSGELVLPQNGSLLIENCSVADCYLECTGTGYGCGVGAILGYESNSWADNNITYASGLVDDSALTLGYYDVDGNGKNTYYNGEFTINNCFVDLDDDKLVSAYASNNTAVRGGLAAYATTNAGVFKNCIVIGITPYSTYKNTANNNHQHTALASHFSNIYTTAATGTVTIGGSVGTNDFTNKVFQLTEAEMSGAAAKNNMTALDWNTVWTTTDSYPTFINKDYVAPSSGLTIYWDGTVATGFASGTGEKDDPYIIATASQLAYLVKDNATVSPGKYFKVADGISNIVLQKADYATDIIALGSAAETKAYFEANASSLAKWPNYGWEGSSFCGYFDGNGATVYGLYQTSTNNAGLFANADAGATICNIALKNSYLTTSSTSYQVGGIVAASNSTTYGGLKAEGVIWVNGCTVANNYMYNPCTSYVRSGVIAGSIQNDIIIIDNCLTYGNDATYGTSGSEVKMAAYGDGNNDVETTATKPAELPSYVENSGYICNTVRNSIILDCDAMNTACGRSYRKNAGICFVNVYTNGASGEVTFTDGTFTYTDAQVKAINAADVKGDNAADIISALNAAAIGDTTWYVGTTGDMPGFKEAGALSSGLQAIYDGITLTPDTYNDTGIDLFSLYDTSVNLNSNPYMSFAFEFGGELKENRGDITITFTYTVNGQEFTKVTTVPAFEGDGTINGTDGWYNRPSAGRFHTYRFKDIPVEALANPIQVSANYGGTDYDLGTVSVGGIAYEYEAQNKVTPSDYYATRIEAAKALLFYTQMIHARYGA